MVDHVAFVVTDLAASAALYERLLAPLGFEVLYRHTTAIAFGADGIDDFGLNEGTPGEQPTVAAHVAFVAETRDQVDAFHAAAVAAGLTDITPPSVRPEYSVRYYACFVRDLQGNNIEAVWHASTAQA
ncbi:VOC family protein [Tenggerimyces flavus]|uniref:VOC family protein n=1 Tax=Tenggerimyces flavus TaxID=1708749 RepID=A0ABV7YP76_9ACTN|nr:VOC family protein [Tenggerimyces flavus]